MTDNSSVDEPGGDVSEPDGFTDAHARTQEELRESYEDATEDLERSSEKVSHYNEVKKATREEISKVDEAKKSLRDEFKGALAEDENKMAEQSFDAGEPGEGMIQEVAPSGESGPPGEETIQEPAPGGGGQPGEAMTQEPAPSGESGPPGEETIQDEFAPGSELGGEAMPPLTDEPERQGAVSGGPNWKVVGPIAAAVGLALIGGMLWLTGVFDGDDGEEVSVVANGDETEREGRPTDEPSPGATPSEGQSGPGSPSDGGPVTGVLPGTCTVTVEVELIQSDDGRWYNPAVDLWFRQVAYWRVQTSPEYAGLRGQVQIRPDIVERFTTDTGGTASGATDVYPGTPTELEVVAVFENIPGETDYQSCTGVDQLPLEETTPEPD